MEIDSECTLLNDAQIYLYLSATYRNNLYYVNFNVKFDITFLMSSLAELYYRAFMR